MVSIKKVTIMFFCKCLIISFLSVPFIAVAKDVTVVPSITLRGEYGDNVYFTRTDEISDYLTIISPGLKLDFATEVFNIRGSGLVDVLRHIDEKDIDTEKQKLRISTKGEMESFW